MAKVGRRITRARRCMRDAGMRSAVVVIRRSRRVVVAVLGRGSGRRGERRFCHRHVHDAQGQDLAQQDDEHDGATVNEARHPAQSLSANRAFSKFL